ncbi:DoxX family protein [Aneurinibacillus sp. Ricciae_BoGa-3]|uniref:DoxX family protein n=1 Tax=Aneurinibacillus sp. Ricciae_BoGa-3 TaxID=3022697 RepID=UPI002342820C|nr:DoxX family protein [Aneurinibacillus sp. Ricciae_BoGa-3]WCK53262.1 DoxX family protein [Aneurinibacillus sp. Ricciae_BoGa-3]
MLQKYRAHYMVPVWTLVRLWLGYEWIVSGWEKLMGGFNATGFLKGAIANAGGAHPAVQGWYAAFLRGFALPNVELFDFIVPWGEFLIGVGLILGAFTTIALFAGIFMNLNFMLAGTTSTNPILYTIAVLLLIAGAAAYTWGLDRYMIPWLKAHYTLTFKHKDKKVHF